MLYIMDVHTCLFNSIWFTVSLVPARNERLEFVAVGDFQLGKGWGQTADMLAAATAGV